MPRLFYLLLLGSFVGCAAHATGRSSTHAPKAHLPPVATVYDTDATEALNTQSLTRAQRLPPVMPPVALPDGTIARGTGVLAPELLDAPVYNPADRR